MPLPCPAAILDIPKASKIFIFYDIAGLISNMKQITKPQICNSRNQEDRRERRILVFINKQCDFKEIIYEILMGHVDF